MFYKTRNYVFQKKGKTYICLSAKGGNKKNESTTIINNVINLTMTLPFLTQTMMS